MSNQIRTIVKAKSKTLALGKEITLRKHLNADALFHNMRKGFKKIKDTRTGNGKHSLADALMSGFAMFSLKDPSLLQFDSRRSTGPHNLKTIYGIGTIPCDTTMREILDVVDPNNLRPLFKDGFRALQRGKALEQMVFMDGYYLLNLGGETKNDCERNAIIRLLKKLKKEHPHLKLIIYEDSLSSNAPHINDLEKYNHKYILVLKRATTSFFSIM